MRIVRPIQQYPRTATALAATVVATVLAVVVLYPSENAPAKSPTARAPQARPISTPGPSTPGLVSLTGEQSRAIELKTEVAGEGTASDLLQAPGQIIPDEMKFAYITPHAAGVVREVAAYEGQQVKAGDLLATVDSTDVARARFELYTRLQELDVAKSQAQWGETVYENTIALLDRLKAGDSPEAIQRDFLDRPVGANREQLITAYANERLAHATYDRRAALHEQKIISTQEFQQSRATYNSAEAAYLALTEEMRYSARLELTRARQALQKAESAVRVAHEQLRVYGVRGDGTEPPVEHGKVVGVRPDGSLEAGPDDPKGKNTETILPSASAPVPGAAPPPPGSSGDTRLASTYSIWAPFSGTVIDRMQVVPGVSVDTTHRIFTLADLSTVWVEVHVPEYHYGLLSRGRGTVTFTSPAYPDQVFEASILYKGDLVDPKSRTLKLLARAQNSERLLKPGMFVDVDLRFPNDRPAAIVPATALLSESAGRLIFVEVSPGRFERRPVTVGATRAGAVEILDGVKPGERVVVAGGFKLKSEAARQDAEAAVDAEAQRAPGRARPVPPASPGKVVAL